jgi:hypothetical protein
MAQDKKSTVLCTSTHVISLDGGKPLGPGCTDVIDVMGSPHNRSLVLDGHLLVTDGPTPRSRQDQELVDNAAKEND